MAIFLYAIESCKKEKCLQNAEWGLLVCTFKQKDYNATTAPTMVFCLWNFLFGKEGKTWRPAKRTRLLF
jgi:hypothetical protein